MRKLVALVGTNMKIDVKNLFEQAKKIRENAYAPYSKFKVGAALLTENGNVYTGVNVENVSFGLTICAERNAIFSAVANGEKKFKAIAVVIDSGDDLAIPCGACRQVIYEFGKDIDVIMANASGKYEINKISELLPKAFSF